MVLEIHIAWLILAFVVMLVAARWYANVRLGLGVQKRAATGDVFPIDGKFYRMVQVTEAPQAGGSK